MGRNTEHKLRQVNLIFARFNDLHLSDKEEATTLLRRVTKYTKRM